MRFEGTLKTWNDERGFGFLEPVQGGEDIFVHVKSFGGRTGRPQVGQVVSFEVEVGPRGKKRATNVEPVRRTHASMKSVPRESPAQWGTATLFAIPLFMVVYLVVSVLWKPSVVIAAIYVGMSLATFVAYAIDKSAARRTVWRTPESTLHFLALAGGWPGALLAQQFLRHKSTKTEFRSVFWGTVILNAAVFVALCSPIGRALWANR
jgi:uncharacterized membrane protein YsdA (DUF1294 family)/cold shock CspA family protein